MDTEQTKDYDKFSFLEANRVIYPDHVKRLKNAFSERPESAQYRPILVNEKFQIIDGQHRFAAWRELGMPIYYTIGEKLGVEDAQRINAIQRSWLPIDYARSFAALGNPNYIAYVEAKETWPRFSHSVLARYLAQNYQYGGGKQLSLFREGFFTVPDKELAFQHLEMLNDFAPYYKSYSTGKFGVAMHQIFQHKDYDHARMLNSMKLNADKFLTPQPATVFDYLRALENLYNYHYSEDKQLRTF